MKYLSSRNERKIIFTPSFAEGRKSGREGMKNLFMRLFFRKSGNSVNMKTHGYRIPHTIWMSDLKKASDYGALLAENGRRLKARVLVSAGAATGSGS